MSPSLEFSLKSPWWKELTSGKLPSSLHKHTMTCTLLPQYINAVSFRGEIGARIRCAAVCSKLISASLAFLILGCWLVLVAISYQILSRHLPDPFKALAFIFIVLRAAHKIPTCTVTLRAPCVLLVCAVLLMSAPGCCMNLPSADGHLPRMPSC